MAANRDVESIKLDTLLGNCKLNISAQLQNDKIEKLAKQAIKYLVYHEIPAIAYKKGSDFKRDSEYSDKLANHMIAACKSGLADYFGEVVITTAKVVKVAPIDKLIKEFISLGMDAETAKVFAQKVLDEAKAKPEAKPEEQEEAAVAA